MCVFPLQKCPFEAINIINLPSNLEKDTTHRYSANSFKLHRLPMPRPGEVLGLVGTNGIGKSTALKILAGKQKPNLGRFDVSQRGEPTLFGGFYLLECFYLPFLLSLVLVLSYCPLPPSSLRFLPVFSFVSSLRHPNPLPFLCTILILLLSSPSPEPT